MDWLKKLIFKQPAATQPTAMASVRHTEGGSQDSIDSMWHKADSKQEDRYLRLNKQVANWRIFSFIALIIVGISVVGNVVQGTQSKTQPFIVEVDKLGRTLAVRSLDSNDQMTNKKAMYFREMVELIENLRTVSTDPQANFKNMSRGFSRLKGGARNYANEYLGKNKPNDVGQHQTIEVHVRAAIPISNKTWQIEWVEDSYSLAGTLIKSENWKASMTFSIEHPEDEDEIRKNPIGFYVTDLSWLRII